MQPPRSFTPLLALGLLGCGSPGASVPNPVPEPEPLEVDLSGWGRERIELPPEFAPELPPGEELLLFAPGMFVEDSEELWSYAFVIRLAAPAPDEAGLAGWLELYYDGLITAVGNGNGTPVGDDPASVSLQRRGPGRYFATVELIDAFVSGEPLRLGMDIRVVEEGEQRTLLRITASPQPPGHAVWRRLEAALASLEP